jgi:hypothetical protein
MRKRWKILLGLGGAALVAALVPIAYVETSCTAPLPGLDATAVFRSRLAGPEGRRQESRTWLTYPEWYIVYSADSYGRYLAGGGRPSGFAYGRQISGFWSGLCAVNRASAPSGGAGDAKVMLYTIGLSFSAEMIVKAAYENTIGRLFEWLGGHRSADDAYNARIWQRYGAFMHETPWYRFPFGRAFTHLWSTESGGAPLRHWERRVALSLEYGVKAGYAALIGWASGAALGRDELTLRFVARAAPARLAAIDPRLRPVGRLGGGLTAVEAPRYAQFTELLRRLSAERIELVEIAGNDDIFVTLLAPDGYRAPPDMLTVLEAPLDDRPGWRRIGLTLKVPQLPGLIRGSRAGRAEIEHVYDY